MTSHTLKTLNVAIVGGGLRCKALLEMAFRQDLKNFPMHVVGVADPNPGTPGLRYAKKHGIFTTTDYHDLYKLSPLDLIIEVTGKKAVRDEIVYSKPKHIRIMDHAAANLFWDFLALQDERTLYEKETIEKVRREFSQHAKEISVLNTIIHTVNRSLDVPDMCQETLKKVRLWAGADTAWIYVRDPGKEVWETFENHDPTSMDPRCFFAEIPPEYLLKMAKDQKGPVLINDLPVLPRALTKHGIKSMVSLSLFSSDELVGILCLANRTAREFMERELQILQSLGEEIAIGIAKATLFDRVCQDRRQWESTFNAITAHIFIVDRQFRIIKANQSFLSAYGLQDVKQLRCYEVVGRKRGPCPECALLEVFQTKVTVSSQKKHAVLDGFFRYNYFPTLTPEGEVSAVTIYEEDITDIKRAEEKLIDFQKRLVKSESIAAMGKLAASIAHEIRNPLGALSNSISVLRKSLNLAGPQQELMEIMSEEVTRLNNIVHDFLTYTRPPSLHYGHVDINRLLSEMVTFMSKDQTLMGNSQIQCLFEDMPPVHVDASQLKMAIQNVLINALQATSGRGRITITTEKESFDHRPFLKIGIRDNGKGIPLDQKTRIFEPFFSTKAKGLGLGLATARRVVEEHGGEMEIKSKEGVGTTVFIVLPLER